KLNPSASGGNGTIDGGAGTDTLILDYSNYSSRSSDAVNNTDGKTVKNKINYLRASYSNIERFNITGTQFDDTLQGANLDDILIGGGGKDTLTGGAGNDSITGVNSQSTTPGKGEIDNITGGTGRDTFILGDVNWIGYDDGNTTSAGNNDYALITDFKPTDDIIQIRGSSSDYLLTVSGSNTNLYINKPGSEPDELIAVINNQTALSLTASYFSYVSTLSTITLAVSSGSVTEDGTTNLVYTFTRTGSTTSALTANYTVGGTATFSTDYTQTGAATFTSATGTVNFLAGSSTATVTVDPTADTTVETDETVALTLAAGTGYIIGTTNAVTGTILNDDISVTPIETFGNTKLVKDATNKLYAQIGNNNPIAIKIGATQITTDIYPGWQTLAAETVNGVNQVLWKYNDGNYLHLWSLDNNWNWQSSSGWWGLNSPEAFTQETNFQQDFNGDGIIGQPYTPIEAFGDTKLVQDTTNKLYAQIGNNNPIAIKIGATQITTDIYPGWQTLAAETVNGVNQVLWKYNDGNYLHLWTLDSNWNWQSSTGWWGLNSPEAFTQETNFQQDFNGDNKIGNPAPSSLVGGLGNDILVGGAGNDTLNGAAGRDTLTGGTGTDIFIFQFGQSTAAALDRVTDFAIGDDKIDLLSQAGAAINAPVAFTRATDSTTTNINTIVTNVFTDADGATAGNQALGINSAVLVRDNSFSTYLIINDGTAGFQSANDLVINLTGLTGTLPALGPIAVNSFFV
ncbi:MULTISPECIES: bluetail domain-containing putative surface protein, partial [unclassified Microcystis]|uniref:bluetail domain-containing putative surface protein n=1 Tax=unclassified Microcystis TaxID=2643300 RepID=UPI00257E4329